MKYPCTEIYKILLELFVYLLTPFNSAAGGENT